jgi:hypothetical protein
LRCAPPVTNWCIAINARAQSPGSRCSKV